MRNKLSRSDKEYIVANRLQKSSREIALHIGFSKSSVLRYLRDNDLKPPKKVVMQFRRKGMLGRTSCTQAQDEIIKRDYLIKPIKVLAADIGKSYCGVMGRLRQLDLEVPAELAQQRKEKNRFKKGNIPFYKGTKGLMKSNKGSFKKGNIPANTKCDGSITLRWEKTSKPYKYIKIGFGKWELLQRHVWKEHYGEIPEAHNIRFIDGDSMNTDISNLELISNAENMLKNSINNYPDELIKCIRLLSKLNKNTKQYEK